MDQIIAQAMIDEMAKEYNKTAAYAANLTGRWDPTVGREEAIMQMSAATWRSAMQVVARQAGIKLVWNPRTID
jgi:hypothetical protein